MTRREDNDYYEGLQALADSAFPRKCNTCQRVFNSSEQYFAETQELREHVSGLKESEDDDGTAIVEAYRNCPCGSTLLDLFSDRRDESEKGLARRKRFGELQAYLIKQGVEPAIARTELLKVMHGEKSEILTQFKPPHIS